MNNPSTNNKLKFLITVLLICVGFYTQSQNTKIEIPTPNNSYGIANDVWIKYLNKTNLLLEKIDKQSFLNYIFFTNDGNFEDMKYFKKYIKGMWKKDKEELVYLVGTNAISDETQIKKHLADLQPTYSSYYKDFIKNRAAIIASQNNSKAPITGSTPIPQNCGSPCTNPGFESGSGFWDYWTGIACASSTSDPCSLVAGFSGPQLSLQTAGAFDPMVPTLPVVPPGGGNNSLMLGDGPTTGGYAARASISFTVSAANANFTYK